MLTAFAVCSLVPQKMAAQTTPTVAQQARPRETPFKTAKEFDAVDVAAIRKARDQWISAFNSGNAVPVEFMFTSDAVFSLPVHASLPAGDSLASAREVFARFNARLAFDEPSEQFVTDGGDPRKISKLPWVSYYAAYTLTLTPKSGGDVIRSRGQFMTRFHRQRDGSLKVIRGPRVGDRASEFTLNFMKRDGKVQLSSLRGKPTVLIFGSYT